MALYYNKKGEFEGTVIDNTLMTLLHVKADEFFSPVFLFVGDSVLRTHPQVYRCTIDG